jgi:hypothetical protein
MMPLAGSHSIRLLLGFTALLAVHTTHGITLDPYAFPKLTILGRAEDKVTNNSTPSDSLGSSFAPPTVHPPQPDPYPNWEEKPDDYDTSNGGGKSDSETCTFTLKNSKFFPSVTIDDEDIRLMFIDTERCWGAPWQIWLNEFRGDTQPAMPNPNVFSIFTTHNIALPTNHVADMPLSARFDGPSPHAEVKWLIRIADELLDF